MKLREVWEQYQVTDYLGPPPAGEVRFDCALGTNAFLDPRLVTDALAAAEWTINAYAFAALDRLRERLVDVWRGTVPRLEPDMVGFGAGTFGLMRDTCTVTLDKGDVALGYAPQFPRIESEVTRRQAVYETVSLAPSYRFEVDSFLEGWVEGVALVYLDNPNNPTGQVIGLDDIERIVQRAGRSGAVVLVDEAFGDYLGPEASAFTLVPRHDNLVVIRSASKYWGLPNHRVGYVVGPPDLIALYAKLGDPFPFTDFSAGVFGALLDRAGEVAESLTAVRAAKRAVMAAVPGILPTHADTPLLTLPVRAAALAAHGILAESCAINRGLGEAYSRLRLAPPVDALIAAVSDALRTP